MLERVLLLVIQNYLLYYMNQYHQHYHLVLMDFQKTQHILFVHIHHLYHHLQQLELKLELSLIHI